MSETYEYCYYCGQAIRIGLDDEPDEYAYCGECNMQGEKLPKKENKIELKKRKKVCAICNKRDFKNRKDNHHVIPRKHNGLGKGRVWLCTECHTMLHIAEHKGLCELPEMTKKEFIVKNSRTEGLVKESAVCEGEEKK